MGAPPVSNHPTTNPSDPPAYRFESWVLDFEKGAALEAVILARDGYACLDRQEYRFDDSRSTPYSSSQKDNVSPMLLPPFSDSPGSTSSQGGSVLSTEPRTTYQRIKTGPEKKFKCEFQGCPYSASRRDHVGSHFKAHHDRNPFQCSKCHKTYVYPGCLHSHAPCNTQGKERRAMCTNCGETMNKKSLKRHQETPKCKNNQIAR